MTLRVGDRVVMAGVDGPEQGTVVVPWNADERGEDSSAVQLQHNGGRAATTLVLTVQGEIRRYLTDDLIEVDDDEDDPPQFTP